MKDLEMPTEALWLSIKESGYLVGFFKYFVLSIVSAFGAYHAFVETRFKKAHKRIDRQGEELEDQRKMQNSFIMEVSDRMSKDMASKEQLERMEDRIGKAISSEIRGISNEIKGIHNRFDDFKDFTVKK